MILAVITYIVCVIFIGRFGWHVLSWIRAPRDPSAPAFSKKPSAGVIAETVLDIILFRRLFRTSKLLWIASWTFHISLFLVVVRHLRYFMYPVPPLILSLQNTGIYAGYVLPLSLLALLIMRILGNHDRYVSAYNFFLLATLLLTGITGLLLRMFFRTNLVDIKAYMMEIVSFTPGTVPDSLAFIIHFILVLLVIPSLPFHLIAAPITTMEARRRDRGLDLVMHE